MVSDKLTVTRSQAADLIEALRRAEFRGGRLDAQESGHDNYPGHRSERAHAVLNAFAEWCERRNVPPLEACPSHPTAAYEDNCSACAPRWGMVGPEVKVR